MRTEQVRVVGVQDVRVPPTDRLEWLPPALFRRPSDRAEGDLERMAITDMSNARRTRGLILINTGNGKGKTTAAIGTAFRALGHGMRVGMIQFIKGKWKTGERKLGEQTPNLTWLTMGHGFTWESLDLDRDRAAARTAWNIAKAWLLDESYDLVVFDEITHVINYGFIPLDEVLSALQARRADLHVILTGRDAPAELSAIADVVTEMQAVKHPYRDGVSAQKGIEF
jgi:cob(I)alamin adenosyltransferase